MCHMMIRQSTFLSVVLLMAISLGACSETKEQTPKEVSASDGAYTLIVSEAYADLMTQKEVILAEYIPSLPADRLTLLQVQGKPEAGKMVYGSSMPIPEGNPFSIQQLVKQIEVVSKNIERVKNIRFDDMAATDNEASYVLETKMGTTTAYEACRMAIISAQVFTVCARTNEASDVAAAEEMINTLIFH